MGKCGKLQRLRTIFCSRSLFGEVMISVGAAGEVATYVAGQELDQH